MNSTASDGRITVETLIAFSLSIARTILPSISAEPGYGDAGTVTFPTQSFAGRYDQSVETRLEAPGVSQACY